mgnify:CR=1 FL=1|jgi:hypothetical protein
MDRGRRRRSEGGFWFEEKEEKGRLDPLEPSSLFSLEIGQKKALFFSCALLLVSLHLLRPPLSVALKTLLQLGIELSHSNNRARKKREKEKNFRSISDGRWRQQRRCCRLFFFLLRQRYWRPKAPRSRRAVCCCTTGGPSRGPSRHGSERRDDGGPAGKGELID